MALQSVATGRSDAGQLTRAAGFHKAPAWDEKGMFEVRAGVPVSFARMEMGLILDFLRARLRSAVGDGLEEDETYVHALLLDMVVALRIAAGDVE